MLDEVEERNLNVEVYLHEKYQNKHELSVEEAAKEMLLGKPTVELYLRKGELGSLGIEDVAAFIVEKY